MAVRTGVVVAAMAGVLVAGGCAAGDGSGALGPPSSSVAPASPTSTVARPQGQATLERLRAAFARDETAFGGVYLGGSVVHVLVVRDVARYAAELPRLAEPGVTVEVARARYPLSRLDQVVAQVTKEQGELRRDGVPVVAAGVDPRRNRVVVTLEKRTAAAERALRERFGDALVFEEGTAAAT